MRGKIWGAVAASGLLAGGALFGADESLPPLKDGKAPTNLDELWSGYDPKKEPLDVEVLKEWEQDGVVCRVIRYVVGTFKGSPSKVAAFYAFPKGGTKLPGLVQLHGGGQSASLASVVADAKRGYACISLNWGGNKMSLGKDNWEGPQTDWGKLDCTHPPQRNKANHFAGGFNPDEYTLDSIVSPRNSNWFMVLIAARRAITFLEQQPEVDATRIGVYGHSMGGKLSTNLAGIDKRIKAAAPSCGGAGTIVETKSDQSNSVKDKTSAMDAACISDNAYIPRITCPILWLSPTNDFHGVLDNMVWNWRVVPDDLVRFSVSPHLNHRHTPENGITNLLWFEQHLKGAFTMPKTPNIEVNLKTADGIPSATVTPDNPSAVKGVDIYYSIDSHVLTRFWRDAKAVKDGSVWKASCPVISIDQPLLVYANVIYDTPEQYRKVPQTPGSENSDVFAVSSRVQTASPAQLQADGVKATDKPERMIDDGARGWHDWYCLNWGHPPLWTATTRKLKDPKWRGPDGAKLLFEMRPEADCTLVVKFNCNAWGAFVSGKPAIDYAAVKELKGSKEWQTVSVSLDEIVPADPKTTAKLADWQTVTEFAVSPSGEIAKDGQKVKVGGKPWKGPREMRNLRWEGGAYSVQRPSDSKLTDAEYQKQFNDSIDKSLEQENLDRKLKQNGGAK